MENPRDFFFFFLNEQSNHDGKQTNSGASRTGLSPRPAQAKPPLVQPPPGGGGTWEGSGGGGWSKASAGARAPRLWQGIRAAGRIQPAGSFGVWICPVSAIPSPREGLKNRPRSFFCFVAADGAFHLALQPRAAPAAFTWGRTRRDRTTPGERRRPPVLPPPGDPRGDARSRQQSQGGKHAPAAPPRGGARPNPPRAPFPGGGGWMRARVILPPGLVVAAGSGVGGAQRASAGGSGPQRRDRGGGGGFKVARGRAEPPACAAG